MASSEICQITGTLCRVDGAPREGAQIRAEIKSAAGDSSGQLASGAGITSEVISAITQENGTFTLDVIQGATIILSIPDINLKKEIVVPLETTVDFSTLI